MSGYSGYSGTCDHSFGCILMLASAAPSSRVCPSQYSTLERGRCKTGHTIIVEEHCDPLAVCCRCKFVEGHKHTGILGLHTQMVVSWRYCAFG